MRRTTVAAAAAAVALAALAAAGWHFLRPGAHGHHDHGTHAARVQLERSMLRMAPGEPLRPSPLESTAGPFGAERLRGRWSVVFFGFTSCPDVCPTTLQVLASAARESASGMADGSTQILFVTVDPERDTIERMRSYLAAFDARIVGITGGRAALDAFTASVGAGRAPGASGIDHSTSLFVVDPEGRVTAVLLHPGDPKRILADLAVLRAEAEAGRRGSRAS